MLNFLTLLNVTGTFGIDLALEKLSKVICKLFELPCFIFLGAPLIPYVQAAILNLPHLYNYEVLPYSLIGS